MNRTDPVIVDYNAITPYGEGVKIFWQGLLQNKTAITEIERFDSRHFMSNQAATIKSLVAGNGTSLVVQMLDRLKGLVQDPVPGDADIVLASLNGEIDYLENEVLEGTAKGKAQESRLDLLLAKTRRIFGVQGKGMLVSAACASSNIAVAKAASLIASGKSDCVLVVSCDCVSEFLVSGFSSLMALDKGKARPFDQNREGLSVGEAAAFMILMSRERAEKEQRQGLGYIWGWGMSCDANHMTGPSKEGEGLSLAIERALKKAKMDSSRVASLCAHGTGTVYNDAMEMKAFKNVFQEPRPMFSIKGGMGHTMGSAGLMDVIAAAEAMQSNLLPPTVGVETIDQEAEGWIRKEKVEMENDIVISTNSGFGGINAALVVGEGCAS